MTLKKVRGAVEAILFASGDAVSLSRIADVTGIDRATAGKVMTDLTERFNSSVSGLQIVCLGGCWQMCTRPEYADYVRKALDMRRNMPLSQAALEVLAVVAYNQPVTKAYIEQVRGVDCSGVLSSLSVKGLVEERGRLELPGRPLLYGTTPEFLRCLGISSLDELPPLERGSESAEPEGETG